MASLGDAKAALDMFVQKGEWGQCLQLAEKQGGEVLNRYLVMCVKT
jgi:intraflagellar transport protein 172